MTDREEMARAVWAAEGRKPEGFDNPMNVGLVRKSSETADALWAAGWRKKPERAQVIRALAKEQLLDGYTGGAVERFYGPQADAVLALMDGPTETGEK